MSRTLVSTCAIDLPVIFSLRVTSPTPSATNTLLDVVPENSIGLEILKEEGINYNFIEKWDPLVLNNKSLSSRTEELVLVS